MAKRITEDQKSEIYRLSQNPNFTQKEVADQVGCSVVAVNKYKFQESEETKDSSEPDALDAVADIYQKIIDAKDDHIESLERVISLISGVPFVTKRTLANVGEPEPKSGFITRN